MLVKCDSCGAPMVQPDGYSEPEGQHSQEYTQQYKEFNKIAKEDVQLKKNGQLSQDYLNAMGDK